MLMSHGCGILSPLSSSSPSSGASSVAGEGHQEVLGPLHAWLGGDTATLAWVTLEPGWCWLVLLPLH